MMGMYPAIGILYGVIWLVVCIIVLVAFVRGMLALERIARSVERLELRIGRQGDEPPPPPRTGGLGGV